MTLPAPVIVGGMGGSGSRVLARTLMELRFYLSPRRNSHADDALDVAFFDYRWSPPFLNGQVDHEQMRREFTDDVLPKLRPGGRWGWKHNPSVHLLPFYNELFPDLRFIHIIRDARDVVARGGKGSQAHVGLLGRALLDGDSTPILPDDPGWTGRARTLTGEKEGAAARVSAFWGKLNREAADFGERVLGDRYLRLRLEDLVDAPQEGVAQMARFVGAGEPSREVAELFARPASMGAGKQARLPPDVLKSMEGELMRFGYAGVPDVPDAAGRYIELLHCGVSGGLSRAPRAAQPKADGPGVVILDRAPQRLEWPVDADTMIGTDRLGNIRYCVEDVLAQDVPGDLIETGVWRGGATVFMRGILAAHDVRDRRVWVADSFQGLPPPDMSSYPADENDRLHEQSYLAVSEMDVRAAFERYDLLDEQVRFLPGWFRDTLPSIPADQRFAVVRLDGDMYEATILGLETLYPRLSVGGYLIVDDYGVLESCRRAVEEYRARHGIVEPIQKVDWTCVYWRKTDEVGVSPAGARGSRSD